MKAGIFWGIILGVLLGVPVAGAQKAAAPSAAAPSATAPSATAPSAISNPSSTPQAAKKPAAPAASEKSGKRRDPFNSLISNKKSEEPLPTRLPPGKKGLVIEQLQLQGIVRGIDGGWIAVVDNKTRRAYFLRENDQLYNGVVSKITADSVVFLESPTDALGKVVPREVVKRLAAQ